MLVAATLTWLSVILFMLDVLSSSSEWQRKVLRLNLVAENRSSGFHLGKTSRGRGWAGGRYKAVGQGRCDSLDLRLAILAWAIRAGYAAVAPAARTKSQMQQPNATTKLRVRIGAIFVM